MENNKDNRVDGDKAGIEVWLKLSKSSNKDVTDYFKRLYESLKTVNYAYFSDMEEQIKTKKNQIYYKMFLGKNVENKPQWKCEVFIKPSGDV